MRRRGTLLRSGPGCGQTDPRGCLCRGMPTATRSAAVRVLEIAGAHRRAHPPEAAMTRPEDVLVQRLGEAVVEQVRFRDDLTLIVPREHMLRALEIAGSTGFRLLTDLTAVDRHPAQPRFDVIYVLTSVEQHARIRFMVHLAADQTMPSATSLWPGANWLEREVFDLFGIRFDGHPDLRRILMPDDWEGHPLRKDYPLVEEPVEFKGHTPKVPSEIIPKSKPKLL